MRPWSTSRGSGATTVVNHRDRPGEQPLHDRRRHVVGRRRGGSGGPLRRRRRRQPERRVRRRGPDRRVLAGGVLHRARPVAAGSLRGDRHALQLRAVARPEDLLPVERRGPREAPADRREPRERAQLPVVRPHRRAHGVVRLHRHVALEQHGARHPGRVRHDAGQHRQVPAEPQHDRQRDPQDPRRQEQHHLDRAQPRRRGGRAGPTTSSSTARSSRRPTGPRTSRSSRASRRPNFLGTTSSTPHDKNFHLWVGGADKRRHRVRQQQQHRAAYPFHLLGRAPRTSARASRSTASGTGTSTTAAAGRSGSRAAPARSVDRRRTRSCAATCFRCSSTTRSGTRPRATSSGVSTRTCTRSRRPSTTPCVVVDLQFQQENGSRFVIDDFQSEPDPLVASSGATVSVTTQVWETGLYDDPDSNFIHSGDEPFNGFTYSRPSDFESGAVLGFDSDASVVYDIEDGDENWSGFAWLSFRACQVTRHPTTEAELADTVFEVRLVDGDGDSSTIGIEAFEGGIEEPYQRTGCGGRSAGLGQRVRDRPDPAGRVHRRQPRAGPGRRGSARVPVRLLPRDRDGPPGTGRHRRRERLT